MILVTEVSDCYEIKFSYDLEIIQMVKLVPGRRWEPDRKVWTIPKDKLGFLLNQFKSTPYESQLKIESSENLFMNAEIGSSGVIPDIDISDVTFYCEEGASPFSHQIDFMKFAKNRYLQGMRSGFLLADVMGTGKTFEILQLAMYKRKTQGLKHCLVIACVNSAKYNWKADIFKHTRGVEDPYILGSRRKRDGTLRLSTGSKEKFEDLVRGTMYGEKDGQPLPFFLILNIEALRYKMGKNYLITEELIRWCENKQIEMIALDEIHHNCSPTSVQGAQVLKMKKKVATGVEWIPMTGTPITNRPTDLFTPLRLVDGHYGNSYWSWCQSFCMYGGYGGKDIVGYKNIPYLKSILEPNMLRRLKSDVLDLPPKIYNVEYVENTPYQTKLYNELLSGMLAERSEILQSLNPASRFLRLRQVNGSPEIIDPDIDITKPDYLSKNAKLARLLELLDEIVDNGEKAIVFSNWVEPLRTLYRFVSQRHKTCCYTGTMSPDERELHKQAFIYNPEYKIMLGTIGALGTSHTLTVANNIIFYDECWTPADMEQASDRAHRPGQKKTVNIYTLITKNTVDDKVHDILYTKQGISQYIVDNSIDIHNHPELFDLLLANN